MGRDELMPRSKSWQEELYIFGRRIKACANSFCFLLCRVFPIDKQLVSVCTFEGKGGFGCNPKYVVMELHKQRPDIKFVWFVNKNVFDEKQFPEYVKKVPNTLWSRTYWLSKSKVWIDNYRKPYGTIKRKGQYYLNTNHYTIGIKTVGLWRGGGFSKMAYLVSKNDSDMIDDLIIDSKFGEEMVPKGLIYTGHLLKCGAPRCDVLYGDRAWAKTLFRENHNLPSDSKVVMFAPTFREGAKNGKRSVYSEKWSLDFARLVRVLERKFGGTWYICLRVHPQLANSFAGYADSEIGNRMIDVSSEDDMYEILAGMDAYITDYSSACFEAGFAKIPTFIYADDIDRYTKNRGSLFWNITSENCSNVSVNKNITPGLDVTFPFAIAVDNDELCEFVSRFDASLYEEKLEHFLSEMGMVFAGKAAKKVAQIVIDELRD